MKNGEGVELERISRESAGARRYANAHRAKFEVNEARDRLVVTYNMDHKLWVEQAPYMEWPAALEALAETGLHGMSALEFATYHPAEFWLYRYHRRTPDDLQGLVRF